MYAIDRIQGLLHQIHHDLEFSVSITGPLLEPTELYVKPDIGLKKQYHHFFIPLSHDSRHCNKIEYYKDF